MLWKLLLTYSDDLSFLNVFRYITVRSALAGATAFFLALTLGPLMITLLKRAAIGQTILQDGPQTHQVKAGTPTMGGLLILFALLTSCLLWTDLTNPYIWIQLFATLGFALVGYVDDRSKILKKQNLGLTAFRKMAMLMVISVIIGIWLYRLAEQGDFITELYFPFFKHIHPNLGWLFIPFSILVLLATSNTVNLTDGLDGLAIGASGIAFVTFTLIAYVTSHVEMSTYLNIPHLAHCGELAVYGAAIVGASLGFLWHNAHPAELFMGDTGALCLGGALGTMALLTGHPLLLVVVGGLFVIEGASVILQVGSYRFRGKRLFRMAPIHHHFELKGWHESQVIIRFWIVSILFAILALSTFKLR